jgi:hypothetical protein
VEALRKLCLRFLKCDKNVTKQIITLQMDDLIKHISPTIFEASRRILDTHSVSHNITISYGSIRTTSIPYKRVHSGPRALT